jgi:transcriptional regulator with XRE-family HTH domain
MDEHHSKLEAARRLRGWTLEAASQKIGVHPQTLRSWEKGKSRPRNFRIRKMSEIYETTPAALGFGWDYARSPASAREPGHFAGSERASSHLLEAFDTLEKLDLRLMSLIIQRKQDHQNRDYHAFQLQINRCIKAYDQDMQAQHGSAFDDAERLQALSVIAAIPVAVYLGRVDQAVLPEDILIHCAAGITVCWHMGQDSLAARSFVSGYLMLLSNLYSRVRSYRAEIVELLAQACLLRTLLASQLEDSQTSVSYYLKALDFGSATEEIEPLFTCLPSLHCYGRQPEQVLERIADSIWLLKPAPPPPDFALISDYVRELATLYQLSLSDDELSGPLFTAEQNSQAALPEPDRSLVNIDYATDALNLWNSLMQHELGEYARTLGNLRAPDELEAVYDAPELVRQEFLTNRALAALRLHDMNQAITNLRAAIPAALSLGDEQELVQAREAYHLMQFLLPVHPGSADGELKDMLKKHD